MSGAVNEAFILAILTLKAVVDGSSITVNVTNLPKTDELPTTVYYPIIKTVGEVGVSVGDFLPESLSSSIILNNSHGSFGLERRLSDLFERYTIINQEIKLEIAIGADGESASETRALEFVGVVQNVQISDSEMRISIAGQGIPDRIMNCIIDSNEALFVGNDINTLGQSIPLIFGEGIETKPIHMQIVDEYSYFAYQSTLGIQFVGGLIDEFYHRTGSETTDSDSYRQVYSAASVTTKLFDKITGTLSSSPPTSLEEAHRTRDIAPGVGESYIVTHTEVVFLQGTAGATGNISLEIWAKAPSGYPLKLVAQSIRDKSDYTWGAGNVTVHFVFERPIPLTSPYGYVAYITQTILTGGTIYPSYITGGGAGSGVSYTKYDTSGSLVSQNWTKHVYNQNNFASAFYGLVFVNNYFPTAGQETANGTSAQTFLVECPPMTGGWSTLELPDLSTLDFVIKCDGLKDDSSGTITGTPNAVLKSPQHIAEVLCYDWNGSAWVAGKFLDTHHSATHSVLSSGLNTRVIGGYTQGLNTRTQILAEIARSSASKITMNQNATQPLGFWAWGTRTEETIWLDEEDFSLLSHEILGTETVINTVEMYYAQQVKPIAPLLRNGYPIFANGTGQFRSYAGRIYSTGTAYPSYLAFGERRNAALNYDYIQDSITANNIANFLVKYYEFPHQYAEIDIPYNKFKALKIMDVIGISSTKLPTFFGTTPSATMPTYAGDATNITEGYQFRRAKIYRAMIESRRVIFDQDDQPRLRLRLRLITNAGDPS